MMLKNKRYDVRSVRLGGYRLEVYWRCDALGDGPCMSLHVAGREHARFDLFDPAHKHLYRHAHQPRVYYPPGKTLAEYIDLAIADLVKIHPQAQRAAGWATEQLTIITKPVTKGPAPRPKAPTPGPAPKAPTPRDAAARPPKPKFVVTSPGKSRVQPDRSRQRPGLAPRRLGS
jgi:hypothetical protein